MSDTTDTGLPPWVYCDRDFLALERSAVFAPSWQIVCHESDVAERGAYATLNISGALIAVLRGDDGVLRAFRNVCRHRAARLLDDPFGVCSSRVVCPYHAWTYDRAGRLVGVPQRERYEPFENEDFGLAPVALKEAGGFVFVNPGDEASSFDAFIAPMMAEFEHYKTKDMRALGRITLRERAVNWKIAVENFVDYLHLPVAHNGLDALVGRSYGLDVKDGACVITADIDAAQDQTLSAQAYRRFLPEALHLPAGRRRQWRYVMLWPNLAFDIYPEQIDFMQFIPLSADRTLLREISYGLPDTRREMKAARYLNWRINRVVNLEDKDIIERTQAGMNAGVAPGPIARDEAGLRHFAERIRKAVPAARHREKPAGGPSA